MLGGRVVEKVIIAGTGSYVPENIITNDDLSKIVNTNDEWISSRTGIKQRRISTGETTSELAFKAAEKALESAGERAEDIDLIICATITPDDFMPSTACKVQAMLKADKAIAFDLSAACSGFIYSIIVAQQFLSTGMYKKALVIGAEVMSKIVDWKDRSTCVLFGDGAGAVVLKVSDKEGIIQSCLCSDGSKGDMLLCPAIPLNNIYVNCKHLESFVNMQGGEVFKFAVRNMTEMIKKVMNEAKVKLEEVKYIVPHQANVRIIEYSAKLLDIPKEKFFVNLDKYGNTSSASIAIALDELNNLGKLQRGDNIVLAGFGGGMTGGAILLKWF